MILWLQNGLNLDKRYREDNVLFLFGWVFSDKKVFYPDLFSFLLKLTMQWDTNKCRTNSVYKPFCDQLCTGIMVFNGSIFATSLWEGKVHSVPMFQFLPPLLHQILVEHEVDFQSHCSVRAFIFQSQTWIDTTEFLEMIGKCHGDLFYL